MSLAEFIKTKIIATLGPATESTEQLERLEEAGVDVFRLNMSHMSLEQADDLIARIRCITDHVAILVDLAGPKMRLTDLGSPFALANGDTIMLRNSDAAHAWHGRQTESAIAVHSVNSNSPTGQLVQWHVLKSSPPLPVANFSWDLK